MSSRTRLPLAWVGLATALALAGCSGNPTTPPSGISAQDADVLAAQLAASLSSSNGGAMVEIDASRERAASAAASGGFPTAAEAETSFTSGNVSYTISVRFYDAEGTELPGYDPSAVRMVVAARATGSVSTPQYSAELGHTALHDVTGIEETSDRLTFNGDARDSLRAVFTELEESGAQTFDWTSLTEWEEVVALKDDTINPYPLSGRLVWQAVADAVFQRNGSTVTAHHEVTAWVTFNGTRYPEIVVDGTYHYRTDLETGAVERV